VRENTLFNAKRRKRIKHLNEKRSLSHGSKSRSLCTKDLEPSSSLLLNYDSIAPSSTASGISHPPSPICVLSPGSDCSIPPTQPVIPPFSELNPSNSNHKQLSSVICPYPNPTHPYNPITTESISEVAGMVGEKII
jgi:hypothetical protein